MLREVKFGVNLLMTLIAGLRILARVYYEFVAPSPADRDMFAARSMARLTAALALHL
jgi:hypothetical protein